MNYLTLNSLARNSLSRSSRKGNYCTRKNLPHKKKQNCVSTHTLKRVHTRPGAVDADRDKTDLYWRRCDEPRDRARTPPAKPREGRGPHALKGTATLKDESESLDSAGSPNATQGRPGRTSLKELGRETATPGRRVARWAL